MLSRVMISVFAAENPGGGFFHVHQFVKAELALLVVEEEVDVGIIARLVVCGRAEEVKMLNAEPPELGFMLPQSRYSFGPPHNKIVAQVLFFPSPFHRARRRRWGDGGSGESGVYDPVMPESAHELNPWRITLLFAVRPRGKTV